MSSERLLMSVGRDYRSGSAYEYVIYAGERVVARAGFFSSYGKAKRAGLKRAQEPLLFETEELHDDVRPAEEQNAGKRYQEPGLFDWEPRS